MAKLVNRSIPSDKSIRTTISKVLTADSMNAAELAEWIPVALNIDESPPTIDWGHFGNLRFTEPFFEETVTRWAHSKPPPRVVRTDLNALTVLDQAPSLDPKGFIFHLSRCGSTLASRLLRQIPGCVVVSEPEIVNRVLIADSAIIDEETRVLLLRFLIRALGRRRFREQNSYVVKLSSWNVRKLDLFRRAFPDTATVWVQRNPSEVVMSLLARSPGWLHWQQYPELADSIFEIPSEKVLAFEPAQFYVRALLAMLKAAHAAGHDMPIVDYTELPEVAWTTIAQLFSLSFDAKDITRMKAEAQYYSKDASPRIFQPRISDQIPELIRRLAAEHLDELYRELRERRASRPALPRSGASQS